jgi:hypothetical protein
MSGYPVNFTLGVGRVAENITVVGETAMVDLSAAVVGGVVNTRTSLATPHGRCSLD